MSLTEKEVLHVAKLAAIELAPGEVQKTQHELNEILSYVEKLQAVSTRGVPPTLHVHGVVNAFRDDIIRDSFTPETVAKNVPDFWAGYFRVPKIL